MENSEVIRIIDDELNDMDELPESIAAYVLMREAEILAEEE